MGNLFIYGYMSILILILTFMYNYINYRYLKKKYGKEKIMIFLSKFHKHYNIKNMIVMSSIIFFVVLFGPIFGGTFEWYFPLLPLSISLFLIAISMTNHYNTRNNHLDKAFDSINEEDVLTRRRTEKINKILKW